MTETCRACRKPLHTWPMGEKNGYALSACRSCGSVFASPFPTAQEVEAFFAAIEPQVTHVQSYEGEVLRRRKTVSRVMPEGGAGKRFLDVACRQGYAVQAAKACGFEVFGIDKQAFFADFAQKHYGAESFALATAQERAATGAQAELIFSIEGFCEQTDVESYAAALAALLAPGGKLYIEEPDGNSFWLPGKFARWPFVDPPLNFLYLSFSGMQALLSRHGLSIERRFFTFGPFMRLVAGKKG